MNELILPAMNLLILVGIFVYFLRRPAIQFSRDRHTRMKTDLHGAKEQLALARAKFEEAGSRLRALSAEVTALRAQTAEEAARMAQRIQANAQGASTAILQDARRSSESLVEEFKGELRKELGNRIAQRAAALIAQKLGADSREKIRKDFVGYLGAAS